ncbi:MAG: PAS domain S-box protein [Proteobacteria bacterium]|nr:PAS domain S-box protein [Pseudomonadota bacterium]
MKAESAKQLELLNHKLQSETTQRQRAEETIRKTRDYLEKLFNYANAPIIVWDTEAKITRFNHAFEHLTGYAADKVIGQKLQMLFPDASRDESLSKIASTLSGEHWESVDIPILCKDGSIRIALWNSANIHAKDGTTVIATIAQGQDITERKRAEKALRVNEERFRDIALSMADWIWEVDKNGVYTHCSERVEDILGYRPDEIMGKTPFDLMAQDEAKKAREIFSKMARKKEPIAELVNWNISKEGRPVCLLTNGIPILAEEGNLKGYRGVNKDVTESKLAEKALRESEERYRALFEGSAEGILVADVETKELKYTNPALCRMLGYTEEELKQMSVVDLHPKDDLDGVISEFEAQARGEKTLAPGIPCLRKDGTTIYVDINTTKVLIDGRECNVGFFTDITEHKQAQQRIKHLNAVLRSIRNVNRLITKEKDPDRLIQGVCENLVQTRGYHNAWIALFNESGHLLQSAGPGLGKEFLSMVELWKHGKLTRCAQNALTRTAVQVIRDPLATCDCPLAKGYAGRAAMNVRLEHAETIYGMLTVSIPQESASDQEEQGLLQEVAGDIAFALYSIELVKERQRAEQALKESEERYRTQFEEALDAIFIADAETGILIDCNHAASELVGRAKSELVGKHQRILHPPEEVEGELSRTFKEHLKEKQGQALETQVITKNGEIRDVSIKANILKLKNKKVLHGVFRDITDCKRAEEALRQEQDKVQHYLDVAATMFVVIDRDEKITLLNRKGCEILGVQEEEVIGKNWFDNFVPERMTEEIRSVFQQLIHGQVEPVEYHENLVLTESGDEKSIAWHNTVLKDQAGIISAILSSGEDITDKKRLKSQLRQAQKLEAIGTLAGGIAHDFNNILTPIIVQTELALLNVEDDRDLRFNLDEVLKAGHRAKDLVKQILAFSRQTEQQRILLQLSPIVKEVLKLLRSSLPTTIEIRKDIKTDSGRVLADPTHIHQILMNLCTNAAHAMRKRGGVLEVSLADMELDGDAAAKHPDLKSGPYARLTVSDSGRGIDPEVVKRIFDPFFTTKDRSEGTGMGLAVVHGIVKNYGGAITVDSEPEKGTTFHVYFPRAEEEEVAPGVEPAAPPPTGNERILLVDDEKIVVDPLKLMLERLGYQVVARTNSIEALEAFRAEPDSFDLVITDQTMPNMTGKELAQELTRIRPDIPTVLCTGLSEQITEEEAIDISEYVMKPVVTAEMAKTIRKALDG